VSGGARVVRCPAQAMTLTVPFGPSYRTEEVEDGVAAVHEVANAPLPLVLWAYATLTSGTVQSWALSSRERSGHRGMGHAPPPSPRSRGSSAFSYTRVPEGRLKAAPADVLPVQRLGRRILPPHPNMGPVDQSRRIPSSCE